MMDQVGRQRSRQGSSSVLMPHQLGTDVLIGQQQSSGLKSSTKTASKQNGGPNESNVVKSLLTGNKYFTQSSNRQKPTKQEEIADASQQNVLLADIPADLAPGEKIYAVIEGVTYEITSSENQELVARPVVEAFQAGNSNISLEELATISAEQETLKLVEGNSVGMSMMGGSGDQTQHQLGNHHQVVSTAVGDETMQIIVMPNDAGHQQTKVVDGSTGTTIQDFMLQTGQQLPPELQELIAKGLDLSTCEFVIQDDTSDAAQGGGQQVFVTTGAGGATTYDASALQEMLQNSQRSYLTSTADGSLVHTSDVLALLAEASSAVAQNESSGSILGSLTKQLGGVSLMAPEDEDDGEFSFVKTSTEDENESKICTIPGAKIARHDGYAEAFSAFVQGVKPETLASVASSTVTKKPQLPPYIPEFCPIRRAQNGTGPSAAGGSVGRQLKMKRDSYGESLYGMSGVSRGRGYSRGRGGRGRDLTGRIVGRRPRGSDDDSYDDMDEIDQMLSDSDQSDPGWKPYIDSSARKIQQQMLSMSNPRSRGRGRGRPRGSTFYNDYRGRGRPRGRIAGVNKNMSREDRLIPLNSSSSSLAEAGQTIVATPSDPHFYQVFDEFKKGDFVLERKDFYKRDEFPIWRIEAGRLLQKFDSFQFDGKVLHQSASIYSSWSGDIKTSFKAITVEVLNTNGKRQEVVRILDEFLPHPYDENLEQDALIELFNIYLQNLVSQSLDETFMTAIITQDEEYYLGPLKQIDHLLSEAEQMISSLITWTAKFKEALDQFPYYRVSELAVPGRYVCQATEDGSTLATKVVNFYGPVYNSETLEVLKDIEYGTGESFLIGQPTLEQMTTYHALHHFKFLLYKNSTDEVSYKRMQSKEKTDEVILSDCLQNRVWVQQHLRRLKDLLQKCSIVITVVSKSDEDQQEGGEAMITDNAAQSSSATMNVAGVPVSVSAVESSDHLQHQQLLQQQEQLQQPHQVHGGEEEMEGVMVSMDGLNEEQLASLKMGQSFQTQQAGSGITVMQMNADGTTALDAGHGQTFGLVQLEDGSVVHAIYDQAMVTLLQQQQLAEIDQSQLDPEQQQLLLQQQQQLVGLDQSQLAGLDQSQLAVIDQSQLAVIDQSQLAVIDQSQLDPEQQQLLQQQLLLQQQQQQLAELDQSQLDEQQRLLLVPKDEQMSVSM